MARRRSPLGGFLVKRRMALLAAKAGTEFAGQITSTNTNVLNLGAPVASISAGVGYYDVPFSLQFQLDQLAGYTDITNIADKYRIVNAVCKLIMNQNTYLSGAPLPFVEYVIDQDDSAVPSIASMREKMGVRTRTFAQTGATTLSVRPRPAPEAYNGLSSAYLVPNRAPFINAAYYSVPHYGIKGVFRNVYLPAIAAAGTTITVDVQLAVAARNLQ